MIDLLLGWLLKPQIEVSTLENLIGTIEIIIVIVIIFTLFSKLVNK